MLMRYSVVEWRCNWFRLEIGYITLICDVEGGLSRGRRRVSYGWSVTVHVHRRSHKVTAKYK